MTAARRRLGIDGERAAEQCVSRRGYTIVARNYRCPLGEIDLIALDRRTIVFIEVKTRAGPGGDAADAVGPRKQRRVRRAAEHYLNAQRLHDRAVRFDVVAVSRRGDELVCEHLCDAFEPDANGDDW